ncbi:hypothetical protein [Parasitella parasitica]|uniref:Uncharacterized protein n=1 Tax=Parasitella parasitica TaxID=35722 RepID=A0A0B7NHN5_9FUNG|nr:hypothetical protein [Parasitella parasitica]
MNYFNVNDEMGVIQNEEMNPEETPDLFGIANMEWEQYIPGVTDLLKERAPPEPPVRRIMDLSSWKEARREIQSMEVDTVGIRKAEVSKLREEKKAQSGKKPKTAARQVRENYRSYTPQQIQALLDLAIFSGLSARKAGILTGIVARTAQHYVRQYRLKEDPGSSNNRKLKEEHTAFLMDFFDNNPSAVLWEARDALGLIWRWIIPPIAYSWMKLDATCTFEETLNGQSREPLLSKLSCSSNRNMPDSDLLQFVIPYKHRPGTGLMTKLMLQDPRIMNIVLKTLIGPEVEDKYTSASCEWIDGRHADILYVPKTAAIEAFPPVVVEVQNTVDRAKLLSECWAPEHLFMNKYTIFAFLNAYLQKMVALGYILTERQVSLLGLEYRDDPTVQMLYELSKQLLDHEAQDEEKSIEVLLNVCTTNREQYKRILEAIDEDGNDNKRAKIYANNGLMYNESCIPKYTNQLATTSSMPEPLELPTTVHASSSTLTRASLLRAIESAPKKTDMEWVREFVESYKAAKKRMNWQKWFDKGRNAGYLITYANPQCLKNTFNKLKPRINLPH